PAPSPTRISSLSLHDALPICDPLGRLAALVELPRPRRRRGRLAPRPPFLAAPAGVVADGVDDPAGHHRALRPARGRAASHLGDADRKSTRLNSSHSQISYAVF